MLFFQLYYIKPLFFDYCHFFLFYHLKFFKEAPYLLEVNQPCPVKIIGEEVMKNNKEDSYQLKSALYSIEVRS